MPMEGNHALAAQRSGLKRHKARAREQQKKCANLKQFVAIAKREGGSKTDVSRASNSEESSAATGGAGATHNTQFKTAVSV